MTTKAPFSLMVLPDSTLKQGQQIRVSAGKKHSKPAQNPWHLAPYYTFGKLAVARALTLVRAWHLSY